MGIDICACTSFASPRQMLAVLSETVYWVAAAASAAFSFLFLLDVGGVLCLHLLCLSQTDA